MNTLQGKKGIASLLNLPSTILFTLGKKTKNTSKSSKVLYNAKHLFELRIKFTNADFY